MANTPAWFVESDYLASKLEQLKQLDEAQYGEWTEARVKAAIEAAGFTTLAHFNEFGAEELTSPNAYFDPEFYLAAKAKQLGGDWTAEKVAEAFADAGLSPWAHFQLHGWAEGVNPSADFDVNAYFEAKAAREEMPVEEVKEAFADAGLDPLSHYYLYGKGEGIAPAPVAPTLDDLAEAIEAYVAAEEALEEFLVDALDNELVADEAGADAKTATDEVLTKALTKAEEALNDRISGNSDDTENVREARIVDATKKAQENVAAKQKTLTEAEAEYAGKADTALKATVAKYKSLTADLEAAKVARYDAAKAADAAAKAFETAYNKELAANEPKLVYYPNDLSNVITLGVEAIVKFEKFDDEAPAGRFVIKADGLKITGLQAIVNSMNDAAAKSDAVNEIQAQRDEILYGKDGTQEAPTVGALVVDTAYGPVLDAAWALEQAEKELADLDKAVSDYRDLVALNDQYEDLNDAVEAARDAIVNAEDDEPAGLGINIVEAGNNFTVLNDVYIFDDADVGETFANFGASGEDAIYFGTGFTLVALGDKDIAKESVGDASVLEIFWKQDGNNVKLYVEKETFGGNASGDADLVELTLTGVTGSDIVDQLDTGFLTLGVAV